MGRPITTGENFHLLQIFSHVMGLSSISKMAKRERPPRGVVDGYYYSDPSPNCPMLHLLVQLRECIVTSTQDLRFPHQESAPVSGSPLVSARSEPPIPQIRPMGAFSFSSSLSSSDSSQTLDDHSASCTKMTTMIQIIQRQYHKNRSDPTQLVQVFRRQSCRCRVRLPSSRWLRYLQALFPFRVTTEFTGIGAS
jgi:hypothetical protein